MKQKLTCLLLSGLFSAAAIAQTTTPFFGLARKSSTSQVFLANVNSASGLVTSLSSTSLAPSVNLTGAALDPYNNFYHFISSGNINSVDLTTGAMVHSAAVYNPIAGSYFDNFRFNNSDTSLYGLARRNSHDTLTMTDSGQIFLAKINVNTGYITQISPSSVGQSYTLGCSTIDPYEKIFYYTSGSRLIGLDMYTGALWSNVAISISGGEMFDNLSYSCVDTGIYGLVRRNFYDTMYVDPFDSTHYSLLLDSTNVFLGRINPVTGVVTTVSPHSIHNGGYSINAGSTIDPDNLLYYFSNGGEVIAVSLTTGLIVNRQTLSYTNGEILDLMRFKSNCIEATIPMRSATLPTTGTGSAPALTTTTIYPNPTTNQLHITSPSVISRVDITDLTGRLLITTPANSSTLTINTSDLTPGTYLARITSAAGITTSRIIKQ